MFKTLLPGYQKRNIVVINGCFVSNNKVFQCQSHSRVTSPLVVSPFQNVHTWFWHPTNSIWIVTWDFPCTSLCLECHIEFEGYTYCVSFPYINNNWKTLLWDTCILSTLGTKNLKMFCQKNVNGGICSTGYVNIFK